MHYGSAHTISIDEDGDGFTITLEGVDEGDGIVRVNIQDVAEQLYDQCKARIGPWLYERDMAHKTLTRVFECKPDESGGYDSFNPKSEGYHDRMSAIRDDREKV